MCIPFICRIRKALRAFSGIFLIYRKISTFQVFLHSSSIFPLFLKISNFTGKLTGQLTNGQLITLLLQLRTLFTKRHASTSSHPPRLPTLIQCAPHSYPHISFSSFPQNALPSHSYPHAHPTPIPMRALLLSTHLPLIILPNMPPIPLARPSTIPSSPPSHSYSLRGPLFPCLSHSSFSHHVPPPHSIPRARYYRALLFHPSHMLCKCMQYMCPIYFQYLETIR